MGHHQRLHARPLRHIRVGVGDERPRAEGGHLPEQEHLEQIGRQRHSDHGSQEEQQPEVVAVVACGVGVLGIASAEVLAGVKDDHEADDCDDEQHEAAQGIDDEPEERRLAQRAGHPRQTAEVHLPSPGIGIPRNSNRDRRRGRRHDVRQSLGAAGEYPAQHGSEEWHNEQRDYEGVHAASTFSGSHCETAPLSRAAT